MDEKKAVAQFDVSNVIEIYDSITKKIRIIALSSK